MKCEHKLVVIKRKLNCMYLYKVVCTECSLCSIWAVTEDEAREFFNSGNKNLVGFF